ncbi:hypothetical protein CHS0354_033489 [Potamilus streckersoni]|nr:hypothetical protein CHS0354_033489 [Potamilus streckersoni]
MCEPTHLLQDIGYGFKHAYIGIVETNTCYDWGNWGFARTLPCNDTDIECCVINSQVESNGTTSCASNIRVFQDDWTKQVKKYKLLTWNCQRYANSLETFLKVCPVDATKSIEPCLAGGGVGGFTKSLGITKYFVVTFLLISLI